MKPFLVIAALTFTITLPLIINTTSTNLQQRENEPRHRNMSCTALPVRYYTLTISVHDSYFPVTTDPAPGNYTYPEGTVVTIGTVAAANFTDFWYMFCVDGVDPPEPSINVTMNADHTVEAYYGPLCWG